MIAKAVGDAFNDGVYDTHIHLWGVPILEWKPPPKADLIQANSVMTSPVVTLKAVIKAKEIVQS